MTKVRHQWIFCVEVWKTAIAWHDWATKLSTSDMCMCSDESDALKPIQRVKIYMKVALSIDPLYSVSSGRNKLM